MSEKNYKIVISGPESTGKSTLASELASYYNCEYISEYARSYVENLNRPYTFADIENIAQMQIKKVKEFNFNSAKFVFIDTYLIITKVWFEVVFGNCPEWIINQLKTNDIDLYLVCATDLPWVPDKVRENGGIMRDTLYQKYIDELQRFNKKFEIVNGIGECRLKNAIQKIELHFGK